MTPEELQRIIYGTHGHISNRKSPPIVCFRTKIINYFGYPKVVRRGPSWQMLLGADKNYVAHPQNTQYPIAWIKHDDTTRIS